MKSYATIKKAAIKEWELANKKSFCDTTSELNRVALDVLSRNAVHFEPENRKLQASENFRSQLHGELEFSLVQLLTETTDVGRKAAARKREDWSYTTSKLIEMKKLYRSIPLSHRNLINVRLEQADLGELPDNLSATLYHAQRLVARTGARVETRGKKNSPLSIFVQRLINNIEDTFERPLSRSYEIALGKEQGKNVRVFANPDCLLIHHLCRVVIDDATADQVKSAMKNHLPRKD